ncbi:gamma-aminobutyric acid receptor subunit beta-like [Pollicipes pollicipes]|uniref:gamma-aminobutyric acid receptor subunit beta-like n=1 Tax=Pollicipes pollicipes TaxID=41117 RepID=UPI001884FD55|nr:gamma-aminobutyric acid receptor subunit beta-like [Pollicipes pollicipes]
MTLLRLFESVRQQQQQQEEELVSAAEEMAPARMRRSTSWLTSNTTTRSVLPPGYDMLEKPSSPIPGQPLKVSLSLKVRDIQDINEEHMELATEMFLRFYWTDNRLVPPETLQPGQWFNLHPAIFDKMWKPITFVDHMKGLRIYKLISPASSLRMQSDGFIRYSVLLTVTIVCKMSFRDYPFDSQHCVVHLEDYSYRTEEVVYEWETPGIEVSPDLTHDHYDIKVEVLDTQNYSHHTNVNRKVSPLRPEASAELATEMFLRFYWTDNRLVPPETLQPGQWFNLHPAIFDKMWKPITFVDHMKGLRIYKLISPASSLRMQSDGFIRYSVLLTVTIVCKMSFRDYPFDSQHCVVHLEDYSYRTEEVVYEWETPGIEVSPDLTHDHYDIKVEVLDTQNYSHHTMSFPALEFHVNLQRRLSFHLLQTFIPSALFVWVGWLSFLVPPEVVPGRMVLTITTLLTLTAMFNAVRAESPKASYAKAVDIWMAGCVLFVFFALSEYVIRHQDEGRGGAEQEEARARAVGVQRGQTDSGQRRQSGAQRHRRRRLQAGRQRHRLGRDGRPAGALRPLRLPHHLPGVQRGLLVLLPVQAQHVLGQLGSPAREVATLAGPWCGGQVFAIR